jgi:predicted aspartyl protease
MHAVKGTSKEHYTFIVSVQIGDFIATALIDSGSTTTFMTPELAHTIKCDLSPTRKVKVLVANGGELSSEFYTPNCKYSVQGHELLFGFRILPLTGYDIILGSDWIRHHSLVVLDYKQMFVKIRTPEGKKITFHDETLPPTSNIPISVTLQALLHKSIYGVVLLIQPATSDIGTHSPPKFLTAVLDKYTDVFSTPSGLPSSRTCDHRIPLSSDAKVVNQRAYKFPHHH